MKHLLTLTLLLCSLLSFSQTDTVNHYTDANLKPTSKELAKYIFKVFQTGESSWTMARYNERNVIQQKETYSDPLLTVKHGIYAEYENGKVVVYGQFANKYREGIFTYYDSLGVVVKTESYLGGRKFGQFKEYWPDGRVRKVEVYDENGLKENVEFYENGNVLLSESFGYRGQLLDRKIFDPSGKKATLEWLETKPSYPKGIERFFSFIDRNLTYPHDVFMRSIEGSVIVSFTILETGQLEDVKVTRPLEPSLDEEAIRVVKLAGNWKPGIQLGKPVKMRYSVSIVFSMEETKHQ